MSPVVSLGQLAADLRAGVLFCTRLPVPAVATITGTDIARAGWALPVAGAIVGLIAALVYGLARLADVPPFPAAGLTVVASLVVTGCLHEDGLADLADSFGASARERKLEIMRDSKIGTYGVCALFMSLLLRSAALASIADSLLAAPACRCSCGWFRQPEPTAYPSASARRRARARLRRCLSASSRLLSDLDRRRAFVRSR